MSTTVEKINAVVEDTLAIIAIVDEIVAVGEKINASETPTGKEILIAESIKLHADLDLATSTADMRLGAIYAMDDPDVSEQLNSATMEAVKGKELQLLMVVPILVKGGLI